MKSLQKVVTFLVTLVLLSTLLPVTAFAMDVEPLAVNNGTSSISASGRTVTFSGTSRSSVIEDTLSVTIYLQELSDGNWVLISSASKSAQNALTVSHSKSATVGGGKYYRTMSYHLSITDGVSYGFYSYSKVIWVS